LRNENIKKTSLAEDDENEEGVSLQKLY